MTKKPRRRKASFDPKAFLANVGEGKAIAKYRKRSIVFSQGDAADAVFYIQKGRVKLPVVSEQGKEAVLGILETGHFFGEGCPTHSKRDLLHSDSEGNRLYAIDLAAYNEALAKATAEKSALVTAK